MQPRFWRCLSGFTVVVLTACSLGEDREPLLVLAGPGVVSAFEVTDAQDVTLWRLEAEPPQRLAEIFYGTSPEGFTQIEPVAGAAPRPLVAGEIVRLETVTDRRRFIHWGMARGDANLEILNYSMAMLADGAAALTPPSLRAALRARPRRSSGPRSLP